MKYDYRHPGRVSSKERTIRRVGVGAAIVLLLATAVEVFFVLTR